MRKLLESVSKENINFSKHFEAKDVVRGIGRKIIRECVSNPKELIYCEDQGIEPKGHKYALIFKRLSNYDIKVVISLDGNVLNIVTAHIINIKKEKRYRQWQDTKK